MLTAISATPKANALLATLEAEHGPLSLHFGGRIGGALTCLPRGELRIGGHDVLMGHFRGVPLYMRSDDAEIWRDTGLVIALTPGHTRGFSLEGGFGHRFVLMPIVIDDGDEAHETNSLRDF